MEGCLKFYGYEYEVSVYAFFKVAMAKRTDRDEIEEASFDAVKDLYEHETGVKVVDIQLMKYHNGTHFTFADVGMDLRIKVTEHTYERAYAEAERIAKEVSVPPGVSFFECEAYDYETYRESVVGE